MEKNFTKSRFILYNADIYGIRKKLEIINCDFSISKFKANVDVIFLNFDISPNFENKEKQKFSIFKHIEQNVRLSLKNALEISKDVILLFPKYLNYLELVSLFGETLEKNEYFPIFLKKNIYFFLFYYKYLK